MRTLPLLALLAPGLLLAGCDVELKKPSLSVKSAKVKRVEWDQAVVELTLEVTNDNAVPLMADFIRYQGSLEGKKAAEGEYKRRVTLAPGATEKVTLPISMRYAEVGDALDAMYGKAKWRWSLEGEVGVQLSEKLKVSLPFEKAGTLPAPRLPKLRVTQAALEDVKLTEVTAALAVEVDNPNAFALPPGELVAKLKMGELSLDPVRVQVPRVPAQRKKTLKLKQKLRLQNLGAVAKQVAEEQSLEAQLIGELKLDQRAIPLDLKMRLKK